MPIASRDSGRYRIRRPGSLPASTLGAAGGRRSSRLIAPAGAGHGAARYGNALAYT